MQLEFKCENFLKMKLNRFVFSDNAREWRLEETNFNRLTLLVGASGVGKTQILKAIHSLKEISKGESINGIKWFIDFNIGINDRYLWEGEFEKLEINPFMGDDDDDYENVRNKPKLLFEKIILNGNTLAERTDDRIIFQGKETIKLSREKSLVNHLKEETISNILSEMNRIHMTDHSSSQQKALRLNFFDEMKLAKKYDSLKKIQDSDIDIRGKLFLVYKNDKETFNRIKERFIDIFPQVEDIKVAPLDLVDKKAMPEIIKDYPFIQIKEKGVEKWVQQNRISSGMFRSLIQILELYLSPEGTVFLIDEFENSLGINCIDELTADILQSKRQLQFILTSHHPYIINSINFNNWKLVTRNASVVKTHDITKFNFGKSKHDAFMQLLQLDEYQTGSEGI